MERVISILLNIIFTPLWLLWRSLSWFTASVFKETGNRLVKIVGGALAISIIGLATLYFTG
jgi:hypothetical protein